MSEANWIDALSADGLPSDDVIGVNVGGRDIALYTVGEEVFATDNICTHGHARLCDGFLEGHEIECPLHQGKFDVRTAVLGHIQRGGTPTAYDRNLATRFGVHAAHAVHRGDFGQIVALRGESIAMVPVEEAVSVLKTVPEDRYREAACLFG